MNPRWHGSFFFGLGRALYVGPAYETSLHSHHAIQVCVALEGTLRLRCRRNARWRRYQGAVIGADQPHELAADSHPVALFYVEPEGEDGLRFEPPRPRPILPLDRTQVAGVRSAIRRRKGRLGGAEASRLLADLTSRLPLGADVARALDPRIVQALRAARSAGASYPSSTDLARLVGLSAGRFRHLFRQEVGLGYRSYVLWLRLYGVLEELSSGASLTAAAHAAGFADSAHLTRTFRRMFGIAPSSAPPVTRLVPMPAELLRAVQSEPLPPGTGSR